MEQNITRQTIHGTPSRLTLDHTDGKLHFIRRSFKIGLFPFMLIGIYLYYDLFHTIFLSGNISDLLYSGNLLRIGIALILTYLSINNILNKDHIEITKNQITTYTEPVPPRKEKTIDITDLKQLYVIKEITKNKNIRETITYTLQALLKSNRAETLLNGMSQPEEALYLEQEIEKFLNIEDESVGARNEVR